MHLSFVSWVTLSEIEPEIKLYQPTPYVVTVPLTRREPKPLSLLQLHKHWGTHWSAASADRSGTVPARLFALRSSRLSAQADTHIARRGVPSMVIKICKVPR